MRWSPILAVLTIACNGGSENGDTAACEETVWHVDADGDGFGVDDDTLQSCTAPGNGYSETGGDCDDANAAVAPGLAEVCDDLDNNCNDQIDEGVTSTFYADTDGDGHGDPAASVAACQASTGYVDDDIDCDDADATVFEGAPEICDSIDNDCDDDIDDADPDVVSTVWYADEDGDGYGDAGDTVAACEAPLDYIADNTDCDDTNASVHPGAKELCDGLDNDCDKIGDKDCASCGDLQLLTYFDSFKVGSSPIEDAAAILGMSVTATTYGGDFATGLATADVVVVDVPGSSLPTEVVDGVAAVIKDGRPLVFSWWDLSSDKAMQSTLGVTVGSDLYKPRSMYPTTDGAALWEGVESVPDPMTGSDNAGINGQINTPVDSKTSLVLGTYDDDPKSPAILSVFDGAVIVNGYLPWDYQYADGDKDTVIDATELYVNELTWITNCAL